MIKKLISSEEAVQAKCQHLKPCSDCPFSRSSLNGWLGGGSVDEWVLSAHGDGPMPCHVLIGNHCVGAAIYRANVCKSPRLDRFRMPADKDAVFANPMEFREHHSKKPKFGKEKP